MRVLVEDLVVSVDPRQAAYMASSEASRTIMPSWGCLPWASHAYVMARPAVSSGR